MKLIDIIKNLKFNKRNIVFVILLSLLTAFLQVLVALMIIPIINNVVLRAESINWSLIFLYLLTVTIKILLDYVRKNLGATIAYDTEYKLIVQCMDNIIAVDYDKFADKNKGEYISIVNNDIRNVRIFVLQNLDNLLFLPILFFMTFVAIIQNNFIISIAVIPTIIITSIINNKLSGDIKSTSQEIRKASDKVFTFEKETTENLGFIKATGINDYVNRVHTDFLKNVLTKENTYALKKAISYIPSLANEYLPTIILLLLSLKQIYSGMMSYGDFASLLTLILYVSLPFSKYLRSVVSIKGIEASIERINSLSNKDTVYKVKCTKSTNKNKFYSFKDSDVVVLENVSFSYIDRIEIIKNINLNVSKDEKIAIVGETGCGKSTLIKLILGLYRPKSGSVKVFDNPIPRDKNLFWDKIAYVDSNYFIFEDTIKYNITLKHNMLNPKQQKKYEKIIQELGLVGLLKRDEQGFINQFGNNLSGGQKMKISIARALFKDAELLILDEPTSSLDIESEEDFIEILSKIQTTAILVTHRAKTTKCCNKIYVIGKNGYIVESGEYEELQEKGSFLNRMTNNNERDEQAR